MSRRGLGGWPFAVHPGGGVLHAPPPPRLLDTGCPLGVVPRLPGRVAAGGRAPSEADVNLVLATDYPPAQAGCDLWHALMVSWPGVLGPEVRSALSTWAGVLVDGEWGEA